MSPVVGEPSAAPNGASVTGFAPSTALKGSIRVQPIAGCGVRCENPGRTEPGLRLYEMGERSGVEFPVEGGFIDILAIDRNEKFVVIELKVGQGRNRAIGQLLYYMGWVDNHLGNGPCRGMIIAKEIPEDLIIATQRVPGVAMYRYSLSVSVELVSSKA